MASYWFEGTPPRNTSVSVPRLTAEWIVCTSTSSRAGRRTDSGRISPLPGEASQNARASPVIGNLSPPLNRTRRKRVFPGQRQPYASPIMPLGGTVTISTAAVTAPTTREPAVGLAVQFVLLGTLAATAGLSTAGWLAGAAYAVVLWFALSSGLQAAGMRALGQANRVTLGRASLVAGVTALVVTSIERPVPMAVLVTLVGVALALDGVDGQVARRTGSTSKLGGR